MYIYIFIYMDHYIKIYILLYKVKNNPKRWIVKFSEDFYELKDILKNVQNNEKSIGNYYIIKRVENISILDENFKQFQIYKNEYNDKLVYSL